MRPDAFSTHHPAVTLTFFVGVIVLCVLVQQPVVQAVGLMGAVLYYLCLRGRNAWRLLVAMALALVMLAAINPLFNTLGDTVLFTCLGTRPYTLEALAYGASTATMFVSVMLWFACYAQVMSTDKFTYLFGRRAPALTLVLTMTLRLVPSYARKARQISTARRCAGLSMTQGSVRERVRDGASLLSALTSWALEGAVTTADSMRSRGYGTKGGGDFSTPALRASARNDRGWALRSSARNDRGWALRSAWHDRSGRAGASAVISSGANEVSGVEKSRLLSQTSKRFNDSGRYLQCRFRMRDALLLVFMLVCITVTCTALASGALAIGYVPAIDIPTLSPLGIGALVACTVLVLVPSVIDAREAIAWRSSLSSI